MKKIYFLGLLVCSMFMFSSCENNGLGSGSTGKGLVGYYTDLSCAAKASDFNAINQAINNGEVLVEKSKYRDEVIADYSVFIENNGAWNDTGNNLGRFRFYLSDRNKASLYPVIHIIDKNTIAKQGMSCFLYKEGYGNGEPIYKFYAGPIFGNMEYVANYDWTYYTYTYIADNKIVVSNGDIYTIVDGGLIQDGRSGILSKYDPTKLYK